MGQDRIDQHIRQTLYEHKTAIDSEALWESISQTKGRRFPIFYLLSGLAILTALAGVSFLGNSDDSKNTEPNIDKGFALNTIQVSKDEEKISLLKQNNQDTETIKLKHTSATSVKDKSLSKNTQTQNAIAFENKAISSKTSGAINMQRNRSNHGTLGYNNKKENTKGAALKSIIKTEKATDIESTLENRAEDTGLAKVDFSSSSKTKLSLKAISGLSSINSPLEDNSSLIDMWLKTTECPSFGKKKGSFFVEAYSLLDYAVNNYSSLPEFDAYLEERKGSQTYKPSYRAGLQFKYLFDNGFLIKAGLEYSRSREQFRYRRETVRTEIRPDQVIHVHVDMNGDTTVVLGNAPVTIIETKNWRVRNSYSSVDIPFSIGYQFDQGPWFYTAEAGIIYNLNYGFSGMLLDTTGEPVMAESYFKEKTSLSYQAAFTLGYRINASWSFICRGSIRTNPGLINSTSNVVDQSYSLIGAGLGMEYKF